MLGFVKDQQHLALAEIESQIAQNPVDGAHAHCPTALGYPLHQVQRVYSLTNIDVVSSPVVWQYAQAARRAAASGGIAETAGARKPIQSQKGEGCLTKPDGKTVVSSLGTRVGADGTLVPSPGPSQRKIVLSTPSRGI